ncbi:LLM class flavin-dependent oxidoreductase [Pseudonocardia oroxyli]|uniref:Flavin-dependent oxidoreductase, luciferase family (Includes alkanesulfonate monooxygenase SsuD and methylene tetrahydromethanopterin reductase) n=1 Tax=Pseudonocardia oroxyli TaxID=366584 RepID=A0A1G7JNY0_PSEOR|nr:LLM class flavin-dependent oxidoreductase [Pseudonocardia oroxyli]SDF26591.1 Flavin-dependent oxidoreductase, luciferase family (includes alkanesulfonate monooxygenase SsuD and methylene tetrahydromethanopterin reductase) [Pseudonocardia oroxyli]
MELGYLTHVGGLGSPRDAYRDTVALAVAAEAAGYDSFWVAQHHNSEAQGYLPSPFVLLAAVAQATQRIRLGVGVVAVALEDPRRAAEDAAVLDTLSGERVELGVGAGSDPAASALFGRDHERRHAETAAAVDELRAVLGGITLVPDAPGLLDRMWWATGSARGVDAAAARGTGVISGRPQGAAVDLERFWGRSVGEPRVAVSRLVRAGEPAAEVTARLRADPALSWATTLLVQTQPTRTDRATHLRTLDVGRAARDSYRRPVASTAPA